MSYITTCTECGALYEEASREAADSPARLCLRCFRAGEAAEDGSDDALSMRHYPAIEGEDA